MHHFGGAPTEILQLYNNDHAVPYLAPFRSGLQLPLTICIAPDGALVVLEMVVSGFTALWC